jgi:hypothetical protein
MRSWLVLALSLVASTAAAGRERHMTAGLGPAGSAADPGEPGWLVRVEQTTDTEQRRHAAFGTRVGLELAVAGGHGTFTMPIGWYVGTRSGPVRSLFGGGLGLLTVDYGDDDFGLGISPFLGTSIDLVIGDRAVITLDGRLARQVLANAPDYTSWSALVMVGRKFDR